MKTSYTKIISHCSNLLAFVVFWSLLLGCSRESRIKYADMNKDIGAIAHNLAKTQIPLELSFGWINDVRKLNSDILMGYFSDCEIYAVSGLNVMANPLFVMRPLVICHRSHPVLLISSEDVAQYLSGFQLPVNSLEAARDRVLVFATIQSYMVKEIHDVDVCMTEDNAIWNKKQKWKFRCMFITDQDIRRYEEYMLTVDQYGNIIIQNKAFIRQNVGYM